MVRWKQQPHHLKTSEPFSEVPARLREVLAGLIGAPPAEVVLANSSSYGLHLIANGLRLQPGDEVVVAANDFPSDILPWLRLVPDGVVVKQIQPEDRVITADELARVLTSNTRVVCLAWVHSFSGHVVDLDAVGELCRSVDALFVVNGAQGVGGIPIQVSDHPIDALTSVGFKYLCGPYGTGFCWLGERAAELLTPSKLYWLSALTADDLAAPDLDLASLEVPDTAARHDVFGTANFFNFAALTESANLVSTIGVDRIHRHNLSLARRLVERLDESRYTVQSRGCDDRRSAIVFVEPASGPVDAVAQHLANEGVDVAQRAGLLRFAPHFYNTSADIDRAVAALASCP